MNTIKTLIRIDYREHKKLLLTFFVSFHVLACFMAIISVYLTKFSLYGYNEVTKSYYLTGEYAALPEDCIGAGFPLFLLLAFTILSVLLPLITTAKCYADRSMYLIDRLPRKRYHYLLSKYIPGVVLLVMNYLLCFLELYLYILLYECILPAFSISSVSITTFFDSTTIAGCYPFKTPVRFLYVLLAALIIPTVGILLQEAPRNAGRLFYHMKNPYKKGRETK